MKKKFSSVLLALCMVLTILPLGSISAFAVTSGDFTYKVLSETDKTCEITGYSGAETSIVIPNRIGEYTVQSIGEVAFAMNTALTSVIISDGIQKIGASAFQECSALTNITLPDSITDIQFQAFTNTGYYLNDANWDGDALYIGKHLIRHCASGFSAVSYKVKEGTLTIGSYAFDLSDCYEIILPDGLRNISESAFYRTNLKKITIPASVESIGENAFEMCNNSLTVYGYADTYAEAYANKNNIKFITISNILLGDVNADSTIDDWDSVLLDRYLAGWEVTINTSAADMDENGIVDDWDGVLLARKLAGWN